MSSRKNNNTSSFDFSGTTLPGHNSVMPGDNGTSRLVPDSGVSGDKVASELATGEIVPEAITSDGGTPETTFNNPSPEIEAPRPPRSERAQPLLPARRTQKPALEPLPRDGFCAACGCGVPITPDRLLFCPRHWCMLPVPLARTLALYAGDPYGKHTTEYHGAALGAIKAVNTHQARTLAKLSEMGRTGSDQENPFATASSRPMPTGYNPLPSRKGHR